MRSVFSEYLGRLWCFFQENLTDTWYQGPVPTYRYRFCISLFRELKERTRIRTRNGTELILIHENGAGVNAFSFA
jgi:hypothetical protein